MFLDGYRKYHKTVIPAIFLTFAGFCGLCFLLHDSGRALGRLSHLLSAFFIILIFVAMLTTVSLIKKDAGESRRRAGYSIAFGTLFGIATDVGCQFEAAEMTSPGIKGKAVILLCGILVSVLIFPFTYRIFRLADGKYSFASSTEKRQIKPVRIFLICLAGLEIFWLPAFLAYYPAIMSYDFNRQFEEAVRGYNFFFEYQPLIHTFLIRIFYLLGVKLGNPAAGLALLSLFQSVILASSVSAGIAFVWKKSGKAASVVWFLMFALLPYNPVLAISMTKDILFSAFFAFLTLMICRMEEKPSCVAYGLFIVVGTANILFRNNAAYALIFLVPAFLISQEGVKKKLMTAFIALVTVVAGLGCKNFIRTSMDAISGSEIEKYSVPIVQMVRVIKYQSDNLTPEQTDILHRYVTDYLWGTYNPWIADGPKSAIGSYSSSAWIGEGNTLIRDYVTIGKAYPNDYFDAWVGLTIGYFHIGDRSHAEMLGYGDDSDLGLLYTFNASKNAVLEEGIPSRSFLPSVERMYSHIVNGNSYYKWPVVSVLMKPAFYFWFFILDLFILIYKKNRKGIAVFTYPLFYLMTMFLGPCVNFRYIYPFIVALPVLTAYIFSDKRAEVSK